MKQILQKCKSSMGKQNETKRNKQTNKQTNKQQQQQQSMLC